MTQLDVQGARWIKEMSTAYDSNSSKLVIGGCIPAGYGAYGRILHPFTVFSDRPETLLPDDQVTRPGNIHIHMGTGEVTVDGRPWELSELERRHRNGEGNAASWKEVAEKYGIPYHGEMTPAPFGRKFKEIGWPENLLFPYEGRLQRSVLSDLLGILKAHTGKDRICSYQDPPNALHEPDYSEKLLEGSFEDMLVCFRDYFIGYLFPPDRAWIVFTDTDLCYTMVGGTASLLQRLCDSRLEVLKCDALTPVI